MLKGRGTYACASLGSTLCQKSVLGRSYAAPAASQALKRTALHDLHQELGAKMVPFCGWDMPIQYTHSITESHVHTRTRAGLFDVSHMGQLKLTGKDRVAFLESLVVGDLEGLQQDQARLSLFTNEKGGIKDDTVISKGQDHLYVVINAGCADKDIAHLRQHLAAFRDKGGDVQMEVLTDHSLLALQGPEAAKVLSQFVSEDLSQLKFMHGKPMPVNGIKDCRVTRCGYTGEDGFEVSVPSKHIVNFARQLLANEAVMPVGLAARDSLRLEAGLCLYGNDIDEDTTPVEAALTWTIGKRRRQEGGFPGADIILKQMKEGVSRKRVGFVLEEGIARAHAPIFAKEDDKEIGLVTSGGFGPSLRKAIAMGYVPSELAQPGSPVRISVRKNMFPATVSKMPFLPAGYYKP